ncbi:MAG: hypothetical protein IJ607_10010 [Bacteroidaceae bacterium]|nr:hypothetical protein [Bacteroidaceae bacterium]
MRLHSLFTAILLLFCGNMMAQTSIQGDVNHDGSVDISDIVAVINTIAGEATYSASADVNKDNNTDISDIVAIINIIANGGGGQGGDENAIRLSSLTRMLVDESGLTVENGSQSTVYPLTDGTSLDLTDAGAEGSVKYLDIYSGGKIVTSLTFTDVDQLTADGGKLTFTLDGEPVHMVSVSRVDSILVYDQTKEPLAYLGVLGFNQALYEKEIGVIDKNTVDAYKSFVSSLTTKYGTILYYAADNALDRLSAFDFRTPLKSVNLITFTDGLDQGSHAMNDKYETDENYLAHLKSRISSSRIAGLPLTAWSLGLRGSDVTDYSQFQSNLRSLASSESNAFEVTSMSAVNERLGSIADNIISSITTVTQKVKFTIPATGKGTKVRIVLDGKTADRSTAYIEGTYQTSDKSLHDVTLAGITSGGQSSLSLLQGTADGIFVSFTLGDISAPFTISKSNIRQYNMTSSSDTWQVNSEFNPDSDAMTETTTTYSGTAVLLLLDCSSSMSSDFSSMKSYANNFISRIANNANTVTLKRPFGQRAKEVYLACPDNNHPHAIDLGIGVYFACCNVGASSPEEFGGYYAWGETEEKDYYDWSTYIHCNGSSSSCHNLGSDISGTQYDVAHVKWGNGWRMPSYEQLGLLTSKCTSEWTSMNGVKGRKVTGPNGASIFLPAAGYRWGGNTYNVGGSGSYWSSTQYPYYSDYAYYLGFLSGNVDRYNSNRNDGQSVRPVTE